MNKYLVLAILPFFASCASSKVSRRPTADAAIAGEAKLNNGLDVVPYSIVDQTATSSLDVTEDASGFVGNVGRRETRKYSGLAINSTRRGSNIVANETRRYGNTVFDIADDTTDLANEQVVNYTDIALDANGRVMCTAGKVVGTGVGTYTNVVHRISSSIFGCLLGGVVVDTKPYMVGSANDRWAAPNLPGSGWNRPLPQMPISEPLAATSAKDVVSSK